MGRDWDYWVQFRLFGISNDEVIVDTSGGLLKLRPASLCWAWVKLE